MVSKKMVKGISRGLAFGLLIGLLSFTVVTGASSTQVTKIIVTDASTTHHLNLYVAQERGLFKKHGIEVEIIEVKDLAAARDAVVAGKADVFWSCPTVAIAAIAGGAPIKIIAQVKKPCTSVLLVPPNSPIKELKDLNGKTIGGISPTCEAVVSITKAAKKAGAQFNLEKLPGGPAIAALEAGKVDGVILEEPHVSIAELKGFKVMFRGISDNIPCRTINARTGFLQDNADALKRMVKAIDEANAIILKNPRADDIVDIAHKYTGAPRDAIRHGNQRLRFTIYLDEEGLGLLGDDLVELGNIKENPRKNLFAPAFKGITWALKAGKK
jgi:NitT/TauT family transport system substrate-binding protein